MTILGRQIESPCHTPGCDLLIDAFDDRELVDINGKKFVINPMTEQVPATTPTLLRQAAACALHVARDVHLATKLAGEEDKGGILVAAASLVSGLPFGLARWYPSGLAGQVTVSFDCEYVKGSLYLNGVNPGDKVIIVDDLISTGGTMVSLVKAIRSVNAEILDIVCIAEKVEYAGSMRVEQETGLKVSSLVKLSIAGRRSQVVGVHPRLSAPHVAG